jgi:hypothetical protein
VKRAQVLTFANKLRSILEHKANSLNRSGPGCIVFCVLCGELGIV